MSHSRSQFKSRYFVNPIKEAGRLRGASRQGKLPRQKIRANKAVTVLRPLQHVGCAHESVAPYPGPPASQIEEPDAPTTRYVWVPDKAPSGNILRRPSDSQLHPAPRRVSNRLRRMAHVLLAEVRIVRQPPAVAPRLPDAGHSLNRRVRPH